MEPLLQIDNLEITFGRGKDASRAVDGVSFCVWPGEVLGVVGESGSGKSVTALSVMGLLSRQGRVTGGKILFQGKDLLTMTPETLDTLRGVEIGMIFQDIMYSLNPVLTIGKQMTEGMRRHLRMDAAAASARAVELLTRTGIRDAARVMKKYPHQLSGGMRQRVMIAMALACKPKLLIADEPTTALDVTIQMQIMQLLRGLQRETGMAILLITHDLGIVAELADRAVVMYAGQCVEEAPVHELLTDPAHAYTRALMQAVPGLHDSREKRLYSIPGRVPELYGDIRGCRFAERCAYAADCAYKNDAVMRRIAEKHYSRCDLRGEATLLG